MCALVTGVQTCALPIYPRLEDGIFRQGNLDWQADCECDVRPKPHAFIRNVLNPPKTDIGCPFHTGCAANGPDPQFTRSEEHTSELQSLMRISYAVFCLKNKNSNILHQHYQTIIITYD